jgi:hypothetical protein
VTRRPYPKDAPWRYPCAPSAALVAQYLRRRHLFRGNNDTDVILGFVELLGTDGLRAYLDKYGLSLSESRASAIGDR